MDLNIGEHCAVVSCNIQDLLPIKCQGCSASFCREHIGLNKHECIASKRDEHTEASSWRRRTQCEVAGCMKPTLASAFSVPSSAQGDIKDGLCFQCKGEFCIIHRHAGSHNCTHSIVEPKETKNAEARALLAKNFPSTVFSSKTSPTLARKPKTPGDPKKLEKIRTLELMKMRHKATPGNPRCVSVSIEQRLHVCVSGKDGPKHILWFKKDIGAGKALDLMATRLNIASSPLRLLRSSVGDEEGMRLDLSRPLSEQVEDGSDLLILER